MANVAYFYLEPPEISLPDQGPEDAFTVHLGARAEGYTRNERAFPDELDLDVSLGIGETRRRYWTPTWSLSQPDKAADEVARLLNTSGERWFGRFDTVDRTLETLESLAPDDDHQTWLPPRLVAMRIRAQRGEFADAYRDLQEHLAQQDGAPTKRDTPYGVTLARALAYGVRVPPGTEEYVRLGWAWRAAQLVKHDRFLDEEDLDAVDKAEAFPLSAWLDRVPVISSRGKQLQVTQTAEAEITCEVARFLQSQIRIRLQADWPLCPSHRATLDVRLESDAAVWYCQNSTHTVAPVGRLPSSV